MNRKITLVCVGGPCAGRRVTFDDYLRVVPVHQVKPRPLSFCGANDPLPPIAADVEYHAYHRKTIWCDGPHDVLVQDDTEASSVADELLRGYRP